MDVRGQQIESKSTCEVTYLPSSLKRISPRGVVEEVLVFFCSGIQLNKRFNVIVTSNLHITMIAKLYFALDKREAKNLQKLNIFVY